MRAKCEGCALQTTHLFSSMRLTWSSIQSSTSLLICTSQQSVSPKQPGLHKQQMLIVILRS